MKYYDLMPKCELHIHIEGSLEPELLFALAKKNAIPLPYNSVSEIREAYKFHNLQSFLDIYYQGASVLITESDFYDLMMAYLSRCHAQNIVHSEIFFDPQTHLERGIKFAIFMNGFTRAITDAQKQWGISAYLIMCFLRHLSQENAFECWEKSQEYRQNIIGVGLDSSELHHPPIKFKELFRSCAQAGMKIVAHAGEEAPAEYIWQAIKLLNVARIDHGVQAIQDKELMKYCARMQIPLTICPLSNQKLCVFPNLADHSLLKLHEAGLLITINSDDPAYFGGYLNENFDAICANLPLNNNHIHEFIANSFKASFLPNPIKNKWLEILSNY